MTNDDAVSEAARAFQTATERLAGVLPDGLHERGRGGALLAVTRSMIPMLNSVMSVTDVPDAAEIELLCEKAAPHVAQLPWSIRLRGEPGAEIVGIAAAHGLRTLTRQPFMLLSLDEDRGSRESARGAVTVRPLRGDEDQTFATVLGAAFGAPPVIITSLYTPLVLGQPFVRAYLAEVDGVPAGAGLAILTERHVGLANLGTLRDHRRRGVGRAVTEAILRDGRAAGARTAYLHSSEEALPLFEQAGFRTRESWAAFTA